MGTLAQSGETGWEDIMRRSLGIQTWTLVVLLLAVCGPAEAQRRDDADREDARGRAGWELIGSTSVGYTLERETVQVGRRAGRFQSLRLRARGNDIQVFELRVVYENGEAQKFDVRDRLEQGEETEPFALARGGRFIDRVEVLARERPRLRKRGVIEIYGEEGRRGGDGWPGQEGWELIGSNAVGFTLDRDVVEIDRRVGAFGKLRLRARGDDIYIRDFKVVHANGAEDDFRVGATLREGDLTRPVELEEDGSPIRQIEIVARARPRFRKRAVVEVYGEKRRGRPEARWEELGCQKVGFLADRDVIRVGKDEGRFRVLQLRVTGNSVYIDSLRLVYGNGTVDDFRVSSEIREGGQTQPIDLRGNRRVLDRIILIYRAKPNFRGSAKVCAYARE